LLNDAIGADSVLAFDHAVRRRATADRARHTATTVRVRNGQVQLYDGPFAETKELLAGFYLVDAKDLNEAIQIASGIPPAKHGSIEVRPVRQLDVGNAGE